MNLKTLISLILNLFLIQSAFAERVDLSLSPKQIIAVMKPGTAFRREIVVKNSSSVTIPVQSYVWDLWHKGNEEVYAPPGTYHASAAQWITIQPQKVSLRPGKSFKFNVSIFVPAGATGGNYAAIFFDSTPPLDIFVDKKIKKEITNFKLSIPTYIDVEGTSRADLKVKKINITKLEDSKYIKAEIVVKNIGDIHIQPYAEIKIYSHNKIFVEHIAQKESATGNPLLPEQEKILKLEWNNKLKAGRYLAEFTINYGSGQSKTIQREFRI